MLIFAWRLMIRILPISFAGILPLLLVIHHTPAPTLTTSGRPGFSTCHLPCWAGISLSETPFREAIKIISANLPGWSLDIQASNTDISFLGQNQADQIGGAIYEDRTRVGQIRLDVSFPLWLLIEEFGTPYCVRSTRLPALKVEVVLVYWRLGDTAAVGVMTLKSFQKWYPGIQAETLILMRSYEQCTLIDAYPWRGFARLWTYQTD